MQAFVLWMSGSGVHIFSAFTVAMLIRGAIVGAIGVGGAFAGLEAGTGKVGGDKKEGEEGDKEGFMQQKAVYVLCQMMVLALGLWKVNGMGLLPTSASDFAGAGGPPQVREQAVMHY